MPIFPPRSPLLEYCAALLLSCSAGACVKSQTSPDSTATPEPQCYGPNENLDRAFDIDATGCACPADAAGVCVADSSGRKIGLVCEAGQWKSSENGPCAPGVTRACGARAGDTCSPDEYCAYEPGAYCGAADAQAFCKPRPQTCNRISAPVCGCDNKSYGNACEANAAGTGVLNEGACGLEPGG